MQNQFAISQIEYFCENQFYQCILLKNRRHSIQNKGPPIVAATGGLLRLETLTTVRLISLAIVLHTQNQFVRMDTI